MLGNFACFYVVYEFLNIELKYRQSGKQFGTRSGPTFWVQTVCKGYQQTTEVATLLNKQWRPQSAHLQQSDQGLNCPFTDSMYTKECFDRVGPDHIALSCKVT